MLGLPFALAKVILLACLALALDSALQSRPARSHPCGARTRAVNMPQRASVQHRIQPWRRVTTEDILRLAPVAVNVPQMAF